MDEKRITSTWVVAGLVGGAKRVIGLDLLRIFLAILIIVFHSHAKSHFECYYGVLDDFVSMGAIAMTAFFMLSGYSLHLSTRNKDLDNPSEIWKFYLKRFISVAPLYYFVALIYVLILSKESVVENLLLFPIETLGLQSELLLFHVSHNGGTWFISALFLCYFIFPLLRKLLNPIKTSRKILLMVLGTFIILLMPIIGKQFDVHVYSNPLARVIEFSMGIMLAKINESSKGDNKLLDAVRYKHVGWIMLTVLIVGVSTAVRIGVPKSFLLYDFIAVPCFAAMMISLGFQRIELSAKTERVILYLSKVSYPFFLVQIFLWPLCHYLLSVIGYDTNLFRILLSFITCSSLAVAIYECIDKPIGAYLRKRLL